MEPGGLMLHSEGLSNLTLKLKPVKKYISIPGLIRLRIGGYWRALVNAAVNLQVP